MNSVTLCDRQKTGKRRSARSQPEIFFRPRGRGSRSSESIFPSFHNHPHNFFALRLPCPPPRNRKSGRRTIDNCGQLRQLGGGLAESNSPVRHPVRPWPRLLLLETNTEAKVGVAAAWGSRCEGGTQDRPVVVPGTTAHGPGTSPKTVRSGRPPGCRSGTPPGTSRQSIPNIAVHVEEAPRVGGNCPTPRVCL